MNVDLTVVSSVVQWLALGGLFASRAFVPLAALSLVCRLAAAGELDSGLLALPPMQRPFFLTDDFVLVTALLALVELLANHLRATQRALAAIDFLYKPLAAVLAFFGLGFEGDARLLRELGGEGVLHTLGFEPNLPACLVGVVALALSLWRRTALSRLTAQDRPDDLGVQRALAWAEELWLLVFVPAYVLLPPIALVGTLLSAIALGSMRRALRIHEESDKVVCVCGQLNYRSAVRCAGCGGRNDGPAQIGFFGQATADVEHDPLQQALALFEVKRCPRCASHLVGSGPRQFCGACGTSAANDPAFLESYDLRVRMRSTSALVQTALLGAIPLLGSIPAILIAEQRVIAPYRRYAHPRSLLSRAILPVAWLAIVAVTLVPGVGLLAMPLMVFTAHRVHRAAFQRAAQDEEDLDGFGAFSASH